MPLMPSIGIIFAVRIGIGPGHLVRFWPSRAWASPKKGEKLYVCSLLSALVDTLSPQSEMGAPLASRTSICPPLQPFRVDDPDDVGIVHAAARHPPFLDAEMT
jgi:hypothetical protein